MLTVGLVGFGFAGKTFHAPVIRVVDGLRLTTIVQRHGGGAPDPRYAAVEFVSSVDELLARTVDLVVIATPNTSHHPIAKQCLQAGRHVVIDKPFTTTVAEGDELVQLGAAQRRVLSIYQNRRYVGDFVTLRALLSQGALGRVTMYESHFDRFRPELRPTAWREQSLPGSGVWFDLGAHLLDQARSEEHTSELQSPCNLVCRLLLEKKKKTENMINTILMLFHLASSIGAPTYSETPMSSALRTLPSPAPPAMHSINTLQPYNTYPN